MSVKDIVGVRNIEIKVYVNSLGLVVGIFMIGFRCLLLS